MHAGQKKPRILEEYTINCRGCGKEIVAKTAKKEWCEACRLERCREFARRTKQRNREAAKRERAAMEKKKTQGIEAIVAQASAAGMSYGRYVASLEPTRKKEEKKK